MAGLAAYFLGSSSSTTTVGNVTSEMLDRLLTARSRPISPRSRPHIIWNGQDGSNFQEDQDDADLVLVNNGRSNYINQSTA